MTAGGPIPYAPGRAAGTDPFRRARSRLRWIVLAVASALIVGALLVLLLFLYPTWFGLPAPPAGRFGLFGGVFVLFFVLILVFFVVRVAFWGSRLGRPGYGPRRGGPYAGGPYGPNRPVMIARMRYARGEITKDQYDQLLADLERGPRAP